ncbi:MAG TPA: glutathione S-transferase family protein [Gammaproteobacteria bacterium]|nr:glutathione S-transferase family protein [Gammaproteobacteria bacterium]
MAQLELIIGNKAYSGWSMRPWLALRHARAEFRETRVPLYIPGYKGKVLEHSPSGKVPALKHGAVTLWDSLAICEYLAELFPAAKLWPPEPADRATARSVSAEMHSGFTGIRGALPFNCRAQGRRVALTAPVDAEIGRVQALWRNCRQQHAVMGPWLFGAFTNADAMFIPMALRFATYGIALGTVERAYLDTILAHPPVQEWIAAARQEREVMDDNEVGK